MIESKMCSHRLKPTHQNLDYIARNYDFKCEILSSFTNNLDLSVIFFPNSSTTSCATCVKMMQILGGLFKLVLELRFPFPEKRAYLLSGWIMRPLMPLMIFSRLNLLRPDCILNSFWTRSSRLARDDAIRSRTVSTLYSSSFESIHRLPSSSLHQNRTFFYFLHTISSNRWDIGETYFKAKAKAKGELNRGT